MKSRVLCTLLIGTLFFSGAAFGELVSWGVTSGDASASASHGNYYDYWPDSGDNGYYTTVDGDFYYYYEVSASASASLRLENGWGSTTAVASSNAGSLSADMSYNYSTGGSWGPETDGPFTYESPSRVHFSAYTGVSAYWDVVAECQIEEGTWSSASAWAYAYAQESMW